MSKRGKTTPTEPWSMRAGALHPEKMAVAQLVTTMFNLHSAFQFSEEELDAWIKIAKDIVFPPESTGAGGSVSASAKKGSSATKGEPDLTCLAAYKQTVDSGEIFVIHSATFATGIVTNVRSADASALGKKIGGLLGLFDKGKKTNVQTVANMLMRVLVSDPCLPEIKECSILIGGDHDAFRLCHDDAAVGLRKFRIFFTDKTDPVELVTSWASFLLKGFEHIVGDSMMIERNQQQLIVVAKTKKHVVAVSSFCMPCPISHLVFLQGTTRPCDDDACGR
jgi:hypothetical protein